MLHRTGYSIALLIAGLGAVGLLWYFVPAPANWMLVGIVVLATVLTSRSLMRGDVHRAVIRLVPGFYAVALVPRYAWSIDPLLTLSADAEYIGWLIYLAVALVILPVCGVLNSLGLTREQARVFGISILTTLTILVGIVTATGVLRFGWFSIARQLVGVLVLIGLGGLVGMFLHRGQRLVPAGVQL